MGASLDEIEALYRSRLTAFARVAAAIAGGEAAGADAVHDAFVRAVRHRRRFRREGALEGWLWRIVLNEAKKARLGERPTLAAEEPISTNGYEPPGDVALLLATLPERQRLVLFLRYYADLSYDSIATALDIAPGTVAASLHAAQKKLREELKEVDPCET